MSGSQDTRRSCANSRREFLKLSGRIAAAGALAGAAVPHCHAAGSDTIKLALVGCGGRGTGAVADAFSTTGGQVKLHAMADIFPDRLQASLKNLTASFPDKIDVPSDRAFIGFDAYKKAIDSLGPGDVVLLSDREFPANVYPWLALRRQGVVVEIAPVTPEGFPDEDYLVERLADPRVRALTVSFVQFSNGWKADLARLGSACRANGAWLVVDTIQGLGTAPLDVRELPVDFLACGGQKWLLSPWGSGFLYVRRELVPRLEPTLVGWLAVAATDDFANLLRYDDRLHADARRFELPNAFHDNLGFAVSLGLLLEIGVEAIDAYTRSLGEPLLAWARGRGVPIVSPPAGAHRSAIVCLAPPDAEEARTGRTEDEGERCPEGEAGRAGGMPLRGPPAGVRHGTVRARPEPGGLHDGGDRRRHPAHLVGVQPPIMPGIGLGSRQKQMHALGPVKPVTHGAVTTAEFRDFRFP